MDQPTISLASKFGAIYPPPPRVHWAVLFVALAGAEAIAVWVVPHPIRDFAINLVIAAWPVYLCTWIRKIDRKSISLYWALAAFVTGFMFSWILWIVVIFEIREDLLDHYNTREPIGLRLNWFLTFLFSILYFQYHLRPIAIEKERPVEAAFDGDSTDSADSADSDRFVIP